jgi:hypothetical protein
MSPVTRAAMKTRTRALVLALVLLALVLLVGCGRGRLPEGPLGKQQENYTVVGQPVREGGADTISDEVVFNDLLFPAVIDRLVVVSPRHIRLIGAYMTIGGIIGNWVTFPPSFPASAKGRRDNRHEIRLWAHRHKIAGAVIPPRRSAGILLGLEATSAHGSIASIDLLYHVGRAHYEWRGRMRIVLTSVNCRAPSGASAERFCDYVAGQ